MQKWSVLNVCVALSLTLAWVHCLAASEVRWDGRGSDSQWSNPGNWSGESLQAGDSLFFGGLLRTECTNDLPAATPFGGITFSVGSGAFRLRGNSLRLDGAMINLDSGVKAVELPVELSSGTLFNTAGGDLTLGAEVSGAFGLIKQGGGRLTLASPNSFTGATTVASGGLVLTCEGALGTGSSGTAASDGGWLEISGGISVDEPLVLNGDSSTAYRGVLRSMNGDNQWGGHITVNSSRIRAYGGTLTLTGGISGTGMAVLASDSAACLVVSHNPILKGSSRVYLHSAGLKVLAVAGNGWGSIENSGGRLRLDVPGALVATGDLQMGVGYSPSSYVDLNGNDQVVKSLYSGTDVAGQREITSLFPAKLTVNQSSDRVFDGRITGALALCKCGGATLTLSGAGSTMTGEVVVSNGTLRVTSGSSLGFSRRVRVDGGRLELLGNHAIMDNGVLGVGGGGVVYAASGVVERVGTLCLNGVVQRPGSWGGSGSGAENIDDDHFSGAGMIVAGEPPGADSRSFYLSPDGDDSAPGTPCRPLRSVRGGVEAVRRCLSASGGVPDGGVTVWLRGGLYPFDASVVLSALDSGSAGREIVYRGYPGEKPRLHGARQLNPAWFATVDESASVWDRLDTAARGNVMQVDLAAHGITEFGELQGRGFGPNAPASALELFFDGAAMQLARWPDLGENSSVAVNGFCYTRNPVGDRSFTFGDSRIQRWTAAGEIWLHGYWGYLWADYHSLVTNINFASGLIALASSGNYAVKSGMPWYAENLLEELTLPGEWYLCRESGMLYFWPPSQIAGKEIFVSMLESPLLQLNGTEHNVFRDLSFEMTRSSLVKISGGSYNRIQGCALINCGKTAVHVGGFRNGITRCEVAHCGDGGVALSGGDRNTLRGVENYVRNCTIHDFGRWVWTYQPGVQIGSGVGHVVVQNHIYNAPHSAILFSGKGNYHRIDNNHIHDVCRWSSDAGAVYGGRDYGAHGTVIRHNFIHHVFQGFGTGHGAQGIYLDDTIAGIEVFGNICYEIDQAGIQHGGGRDTCMRNNLLIKCGKGVHTDARGIGWRMTNGGSYETWLALQNLPYRGTVWSNAFPELFSMPTNWTQVVDEQWLVPANTVFSRNVGWQNDVWVWNLNNATSYFREVCDNLPDVDPLFADESALDLSLLSGSPAFGIPLFADIPFHAIGPETDADVELACWSFPDDSERGALSYEGNAIPSALVSGGMELTAVPGHPTWGVGLSSGELKGSNAEDAVAAGDYVEIALSPMAGATLSLSALSFEHRQSGGSSRCGVFVRAACDGYATTLGSAVTALSNQWERCTVDLTALPRRPLSRGSLAYRIYLFNPEPLAQSSFVAIDNITVFGSALSPHGSYTGSVLLLR